MTDKLLIEALEEVVRYIKGTSYGMAQRQVGKYEALIAAHRSQQESQAATDNAAFEKGYAQGRADQQQIQEARSQQEAAQEPVAVVRVHKTGGNAGLAWSAVPTEDAPLLTDGTKLYTASTAPSESEALRPLPYGPNDIQWLKAIHGALQKLLKVAEVEQQGADLVTVLGGLIARLETERAERAALSASGQKGESQ